MPMLATGIRPEAGFTLLELVMVLALLGLLGAAGAQVMPTSRTTLEHHASRIERHLINERRYARSDGIPRSIDCATLASSGRATVSHASLQTRCVDQGRTADVLWFFPDGSSSGGTVEIRSGSDYIYLAVNWMSGEIAHGR